MTDNAYDIDDPGVPAGDGESLNSAAARLRGEQLATVYLIESDDGTHVWPHGYPTGAEAVDGWSVSIAWWHVETQRRWSE